MEVLDAAAKAPRSEVDFMHLSPTLESEPRRAGDALAELWIRVEAQLSAILPQADVEPRTLHQAMRLAALGAGKRMRPRLAIAVALSCGALGEALTAMLPRARSSWCTRRLSCTTISQLR